MAGVSRGWVKTGRRLPFIGVAVCVSGPPKPLFDPTARPPVEPSGRDATPALLFRGEGSRSGRSHTIRCRSSSSSSVDLVPLRVAVDHRATLVPVPVLLRIHTVPSHRSRVPSTPPLHHHRMHRPPHQLGHLDITRRAVQDGRARPESTSGDSQQHPQDEQTHCTADHGRLLGIGGVSQKRHQQGRPINENAARDWVRANTDRQSLIAA